MVFLFFIFRDGKYFLLARLESRDLLDAGKERKLSEGLYICMYEKIARND